MNSDRAILSNPVTRLSEGAAFDVNRHERAADILAVVWRYRWAVLLLMILGAIVGCAVFKSTPETWKSHMRLMVESDHQPILDTITGNVVGGVPDIDIIRSQLLCDRVVSMVCEDDRMQRFKGEIGDSFSGVAGDSLSLETDLDCGRSGAPEMVLLLSFENTNAELCEASVDSFYCALEQYFNERHKSSRSELMNLIKAATEQLRPEMTELEDRYRNFRRDAPLAWDSNGEAINPHRERQLFLIQKRSELNEQLRSKSILLAKVESIAKSSKPKVALSVISQLMGTTITVPDRSNHQKNLRDGDAKLAQLKLDQQLVPLIIERNKFAAEFGASHPTVKQLDAEISVMKSELRRLVQEQSERIVELMEEGREGGTDPAVQAKEAVDAVLFAARAEESLLETQLDDLDKQVDSEKQSAIELARFEQDNVAMLREIERTRELMNSLEEQMARVSLTEEEGGTRVIELTASTAAYKVGPNLARLLGLGSFLGLAIGVALALLLEKNANTFRDPDEVAELLGAPVLTHLPFFECRIKKAPRGEINPFQDLDPCLAVVHSPASVAAEAIRSCRTSIFFEMAGSGGKIIQVTSPLPGDGKSTLAGNLACSIAQSGKRVLAIDCDLRRPQLTENFALASELGLTHVLNGDCDPDEASHSTPLTNLRIMPSGRIPANPAEALTLPEMSDLLELLRDKYDFIIIDTPPLLVVTDPSITASMVDGVLMAIRVRRKSKPNARESVNILRAVGARILGVVINNSDDSSRSDGYLGYGSYRYGGYTRRYNRSNAGAEGSDEKRTDSSPLLVSGRSTTPHPKLDPEESWQLLERGQGSQVES
jgi:succinoglycan biosynthesis transport protein ExoP